MRKRVLFDTDVILDFLMERQPFFPEATTALNTISQEKAIGFVSAHAVTTLFYVLSRKVGSEKGKKIIADLLKTMVVASVTEKIVKMALTSKFKDFEDAVAHFAALEEKVSVIVTRNIKDFSSGEIPAVLPEVFNARSDFTNTPKPK